MGKLGRLLLQEPCLALTALVLARWQRFLSLDQLLPSNLLGADQVVGGVVVSRAEPTTYREFLTVQALPGRRLALFLV
jgi:hypothetical protein